MLAYLSRPITRDLAATLGGRWVGMLIALAGSILSAQALGPSDLGRFGIVMAAVTVCGTLADGGLTYGAIRFIAQHRDADPDRAVAVARAYLLLRFPLGALIAVGGFALADPVAALLGHPDLVPYLQLAFATLVSLGLSGYPGAVLTGLGAFGKLGVASVLNALVTVGGIAALFVAGKLDLWTLVAWNAALPLLSTLPTWAFLPAAWLPWNWRRQHFGGWVAEARPLVAFSRWMGLATLASILVAQGDLLLLGRLSTPAVVGVYSVALSLALRLDTINQSLLTVLIPRASRLQGPEETRVYARRVLRGSLALAGGLLVVALLSQPLIVLLYGQRYEESGGIFLGLLGIVLFDLVSTSLFLLAIPLNKPSVLAASEWLRAAVLGTVGWLLIPAFGAFGAVGARFASRVASALYSFTVLRGAMAAQQTSPPMQPDPLHDLDPDSPAHGGLL